MNCPRCARPIEANETTWPSDDMAETREICQDCWEKQCDREWWIYMNKIADVIPVPDWLSPINLHDVIEEAGVPDAEATAKLQAIMDAWADEAL